MFIKLNRRTEPLHIRPDAILSFYASESTTGLPNNASPIKGTCINTAGESYFVKETPEEIIALISGDGDMFTDPEMDDLRLDLAEAKSALASCRASLSFAQNMNDTLLRIIGTSTVKDIDGKADVPAEPLVEGTFEWALSMHKKGHRVRRKFWSKRSYISEDANAGDGCGIIGRSEWHATDWELHPAPASTSSLPASRSESQEASRSE